MLDRTKAHLSDVVSTFAQQGDAIDAADRPATKLAQLSPEGVLLLYKVRCDMLRLLLKDGGSRGGEGRESESVNVRVEQRDRARDRVMSGG